MSNFMVKRCLYFLVALISISLINPSYAFYEWQNDQQFLEARGLLRANASALEYPDNTLLYPNKTELGLAGFGRLLVDGGFNANWGVEFNIYQTYIPEAIQSARNNSGIPTSIERSDLLEKNFSTNDYAHLAIDRLALRWSNGNTNLTLGRQAINLATTFYFTPNDFFAPYAAQTFYRVYKPGVDAVRLEHGLSELSQLSYMGVLGYKQDSNSDTGWSNSPDSSRSSHLIQWSDVFNDIETIVIAGEVTNTNIVGGAIQGELYKGTGFRLEGHYGNPQNNNSKNYKLLSVGLEHQWQNNSELRLEIFYNGLGTDNVSEYQASQNLSTVQYLARRYTALGGSYQFTPLLTGQAVVIANLDDQSQLLSFYTVYSLSDESEFTFNLNLPVGDKPEGLLIKSEFGSYPRSINIEVRQYF
ncbi:MAG: hypothetical protein ACC653_09850 [Gammaproteobacteria bacterium]